MKSKKHYKHISLRELKKEIDKFDDECTVEFFHIQVSKSHSTAEIQSIKMVPISTANAIANLITPTNEDKFMSENETTKENDCATGGIQVERVVMPPESEKWISFSAGSFPAELEELINRHCIENGSDTPDFILAEYLKGCLDNFDMCVRRREEWYGRKTGEWM